MVPGMRGHENVYGEVLEARYGLNLAQDGHRSGPIFEAWPHAVHGAAWLLQLGILAALHARRREGRGLLVTTSLADGLAILQSARWIGSDRLGGGFQRSTIGGPGTGSRAVLTGLLLCADSRWLHIHTGARGAYERFFVALGRPDLAEPEAGMAPDSTVISAARTSAIWQFLTETFARRPVEEWVQLLGDADVSAMPVLEPAEALRLPQIEANGLVHVDGDRRAFGIAASFSARPASASSRGAPPKPKPATGDRIRGPLDGILVLDFGIWIAGPFANRVLADLGARVVKVEELRGDPLRRVPRHFISSQRGKESLAVDLKTAAGQELVHRLVARADIVHHNMRLGVMERLAMGYKQLRELNPGLIYCHSSGYGNAGEWARLPAFEPLHSAVAGMLARTGGPGRPPLHYLSHMDFGCALTSAAAVLAALHHRDRTGEGQYLECPQVGSALLAMADVHLVGEALRQSFAVDPEQRGHAAGNALYECRDGWLTIAVGCQAEWEWLHQALELGSPIDSYEEIRRAGYGGPPAARIRDRLAGIEVADAQARLAGVGVAHAVPAEIADGAALAATPLWRAGVIEVFPHPDYGRVFAVGPTLRFGAEYDLERSGYERMGAQTAAIITELGYTRDERRRLFASGVVAGPRG
jgi:crotonobetainyl-CoA:carnitine CoA-transferase CaiB-like acyl-CoA transferase